MPRTKLDRPRFKPINELRANILERKFTTKMSWEKLAEGSGVSSTTLRHLAASKDPDEWPADVRNAVCKKLGLSVKLSISDDYQE